MITKIKTINDRINKNYEYWAQKNKYYHSFLAHFYQFNIPEGASVLQVGCKNGQLLQAVNPSYGVGIDEDANCIALAQSRYPQLHFYKTSLSDFSHARAFDYIIVSSSTMEAYDIQDLFESLHKFCHERTRLIVDAYSILWEPFLWIMQKLGLRRKTFLQNWISQQDLRNFLILASFEPITQGRQLLIPCYIPFISWFFNHCIAPLPLINRLCLNQWIIARPTHVYSKENENFSVSVIIPCKNERGNIQAAIQRTPSMGVWTEYIFIDGHSRDGTLDEMKRVQTYYADKKISVLVQEGKGKAAAVRLGFERAQGDIILILDGDLTTPPEEMPKFVAALVQGKGEFINGSRLVYGMENQAMRVLNLIANHFFAKLFTWLLGQPIKDTLCGTKVLFKKDYERIAKNRSFFGEFDPFGDFDLIFGAAKQHLKIIDMPIHYKNRTYGVSQISRFRSGFVLLYMSFIAFKKFKIRL